MIALGALAGSTAVVGWGMLFAPGAKPGVRLAGLGLGALMSWLTWRATRVGVAIDEDGVVIRRWFGSQRIRWREITCFAVGSGTNVLQPTYTAHVKLASGDDLSVQALSASALVKRETRVHRAVERLNAELVQRTS